MPQRIPSTQLEHPLCEGLLERELELVRSRVSVRQLFSDRTERRMLELLADITGFLIHRYSISSFSRVEPDHARAFVDASHGGGARPSLATKHLRRSAIRLLFRTARSLGLCAHDPTIDLVLPPRSSSSVRPLTADEIALCRSHSVETLQDTRQPAAWALAEATATTSELSHVRVSDVDLDSERVWLHDGGTTTGRWGYLSPWGLEQVARRMRALRRRASGDPLLVYEGKGSAESRTASACIAISETLRRAGLASEPDIRPASVRAWAGAQILSDTGSIEEVARRLGMRSLDRTARLIGHEWNADADAKDAR